MDDFSFKIENTIKGWQSIEKKFDDYSNDIYLNPTKFIVETVINDYINKESDIQYLQYFFLIADRFMELYKTIEMSEIYITVETEANYNRVLYYLYAMAICENKFSCSVRKSYDPKEGYEKIDFSLKKRFGKIIPLFKVNNERENIDNYYQILSNSKVINQEEINYIFQNFINKNDKQKASIFKIKPGATQIDIMKCICLDNIHIILEHIEGNKNEKFDLEDKLWIYNQLNIYLLNEFDKLTLLTQMLWTIILIYLFEQKDIATKENKSINLVKSVLEKSLSDSIAYSEGIMQLLENSCIHTQRKSAYFSLRIYDVNRFAKISELFSVTNTIIYLNDKYNINNRKSKDIEDINHYIEIIVVDDPYNYDSRTTNITYEGIAKNFNRINNKMYRLKDIFTLDSYISNDGNTKKSPNDIAHHYGIKLFKKIVLINNGFFIVSSPNYINDEVILERYATTRINDTKEILEDDKPDNNVFLKTITEYNMIVPLKYDWEYEIQQPKEHIACSELFDSEIISDNNGIYNVKLIHNVKGAINISFINAEEKISQVNKLKEAIEKLVNSKDWYLNNYIITFNIENFNYFEIEIFAKSLFLYIADNNIKTTYKKRLLFAIYFSSSHDINEFIRLFSIFYNITGENDYMEDVQVALCGLSEGEQIPAVKFIIAGNNVKSAYISAENFAYYNSEASLVHISQIRYLTRIIGDDSSIEIPAQFPFDLYLKASDLSIELKYNSSQRQINAFKDNQLMLTEEYDEDNIFLFYIRKIINRDIRERQFGCKISNIHIRVGSKIHMDSFYEAELLFHNIGNIYRFAFLLGSDILIHVKDIQNSNIIIVGYETYSSILVQEIARIITRSSNSYNVYHATFTNDKNGNDTIFYSQNLECLPNEKKEMIKTHGSYFIIIPIASTLSTIYKMRNIIDRITRRDYSIEPLQIIKNYVVLVVGDIEASKESVLWKYWENINKRYKTILLLPERLHQDEKERTVKYILDAKSEWYNPLDCKMCNLDNLQTPKALIHVDKTSTIPDSIFIINNSKKSSISDLFKKDENDERLKKLFGCITYSHTYRSDNHFQYYIDFLKFYEKSNNNNNINDWLKTCSDKIDNGAFNIIISPLHETNSPFVKSVIDYTFKNSLRFMHIPIINAYKEDIRTKFSYISEEYKTLVQHNRKVKLNVYFVDDSIVTGQTLYRARNFIRMLLEESLMPFYENTIFKGVFLLINRCSYETINSFVKNPTIDFFAYLHLVVPSYNTHNDICPSCDLKEKYELLRKRSSTNKMNNEYNRLSIKHKKKDIDEYDCWEEEQILEKQGYFGWLKQWLYFHVTLEKTINSNGVDTIQNYSEDESQRIFRVRDIVEDGISNKILEWSKSNNINYESDTFSNSKLQELFINEIYNIKLNDILQGKNENIRKDCIYVIRNHIIAMRNYMRLICSHESFCKLVDYLPQNANNSKDIVENTKDDIITLIENKFKEISSIYKKSNINAIRAVKVEWFISYIKVLSRRHLSQYHHVRQAIFIILTDLANIMTSDLKLDYLQSILHEMHIPSIKADSESERYNNSLYASVQYQILLIILHRLSDLQSTMILKNEFKQKIKHKWKLLNDKHFSVIEYCNYFLNKDDIDKDLALKRKIYYLKYNEIPNYENFEFDYIKLFKWASMSNSDESKCFIVENNYKLAEKTKILESEVDINIRNFELLENTRIIYTGIELLAEKYEYNKKEDSVRKFVDNEICDSKKEGELLYQNPLNLFLRFISLNDCISNSSLAKMLQFFELVNILYLKIIPIDDLPDKYNRLCNIIRDITEYSDCHIVSYRNNSVKMLAESDYSKERFNNVLNTNDIHKIILSAYKPENITNSLCDTIYYNVFDRYDDKCDILLLKIEIEKHNNDEYNDIFIILQKKHLDTLLLNRNSVMKSRNILFLREKLFYILKRDIYTLLSFRFEYNYIEKLNNDKLVILHMSDLHINVSNWKKIKELIQNKKFVISDEIDLLLITGDVAQGKNSAGEMEKNYGAATEIIKEIAIKIWGRYAHLRQDWKKRIVIVPGNHDYATMNELETITKKRSSSSGIPASNEGDTMAKFAYFINFVRELLDIDVDEWMRNDLNEIRQYKRLGTELICLNSCSGVSNLRNNKVQLNYEAINNMSKKGKDNFDKKICLTHHTPQYSIDYAADIYYNLEYSKIYLYINCLNIFKKACKNSNKGIISDLKKALEVFKKSYPAYLNPKNNLDLITDIDYYLENYNDESDEKCSSIRSMVNSATFMAEKDSINFMKAFELIYKEYNPSIILGGHTHKRFKDIIHDRLIAQAEGFYCEKNSDPKKSFIKYSLLTINDVNPEYKFYEFDGDEINEIIY
jgi:hypothetical protein